MGFSIICADAHHLSAGAGKGSQIPLESTRFKGATFREIPRIEIEHQPAPSEVGKSAFCRLRRTIRCRHHASQTEIRSRLIQWRQHPTHAKGPLGCNQQAQSRDGEAAQQLAALHLQSGSIRAWPG
jgi:hypothetical protein